MLNSERQHRSRCTAAQVPEFLFPTLAHWPHFNSENADLAAGNPRPRGTSSASNALDFPSHCAMLRQPAPHGVIVFRYRLTPILLLAFLLVVFVLPAFYALLTDWWWFREIGYQIVFTLELTTRVLL